ARRVVMTDRELTYLLAHTAFGTVGFSDLPTQVVLVDAGHPPLASTATESGLLTGLAAYALLRRAVELPAGTWAEVLAASAQAVPGAVSDADAQTKACDHYAAAVGDLLGTTAAFVRAALKALALDQAAVLPVSTTAGVRTVALVPLSTVAGLSRLVAVLLLSSRFGVKADVLHGWAVPQPTAHPAPGLRQGVQHPDAGGGRRHRAQPRG